MRRREIPFVATAGVALALAMTWPLALHLGDRIAGRPGNLTDPMLEAWEVAWGGHALLHEPAHFYDANAFWPLHDSLAFSDSLAGFAPAGLVGSSLHAAILRYDLLFLFTYALAFSGAYLLARELGARVPGAAVAGAAFSYAPFRLAHQSHLHVLASGGIPLALALLVHGYRQGRWQHIAAGYLVALWQVSLGWNLGLPFLYLLAALAVGATVVWWCVSRRRPSRGVLAATIGAGGAACVCSILLALPYIGVLDRHPEARRSLADLYFLSPQVRSLFAAPQQDLLWGRITSALRLSPPDEKSLFLGATVMVLAGVGLLLGRYPRSLRLGLLAGAIVFTVLSIGVGLHGGRLGYRLLYDYAPGWQGLRTPGRLVTFTALAVALLAAAGADRVVEVAPRLGRWAPAAATCLLVGLVLLEGYGRTGRLRPPPLPRAFATARSPALVLPADVDQVNATAMLWTIGRFQPIANGYSGFIPISYSELINRIGAFPDAASVRALRSYGVRSVLLDRRALRGTRWSDAASRPWRGLGIRRLTASRFVLYDLGARG
jgi:hypothetical protein